MKLLLHMCCAPCATYSLRLFREQGYYVTGYFYNPNIHPQREYLRRLETLQSYCGTENFCLLVREYGPEAYFREVTAHPDERCRHCYRLRLEETAQAAASAGYPNIATTLVLSPYQDHRTLREEGEAAAARHGVTFIYEDLRSGYRESMDTSRRLGLYRQKYCGCFFSKKERFDRRKQL
jgi:predicted adenine nucleotide alpha hydrolase (AANH) superfamily ATPase